MRAVCVLIAYVSLLSISQVRAVQFQWIQNPPRSWAKDGASGWEGRERKRERERREVGSGGGGGREIDLQIVAYINRVESFCLFKEEEVVYMRISVYPLYYRSSTFSLARVNGRT